MHTPHHTHVYTYFAYSYRYIVYVRLNRIGNAYDTYDDNDDDGNNNNNKTDNHVNYYQSRRNQFTLLQQIAKLEKTTIYIIIRMFTIILL